MWLIIWGGLPGFPPTYVSAIPIVSLHPSCDRQAPTFYT